MTDPLWLLREWVDAIHFQQLRRFGGLYGVRDEGAIGSALAQARNQWEYGESRHVSILAAAYGFGLTRRHGYSDGNKRVGFVAMAVFLELNGWTLNAPEPEVVEVMLEVASGTRGEGELARWVRRHMEPVEPPST